MSLDSISSNKASNSQSAIGGVFPRRALTIGEAPTDDCHTYALVVYLNAFNPPEPDQRIRIDFHKRSTAEELIEKIMEQRFPTRSTDEFDIYEIMGTLDGRTFKERKLDRGEYPVAVQNLWPRPTPAAIADDDPSVPRIRFVMRYKNSQFSTEKPGCVNTASSTIDSFLAKFLQQPQDREYADLCNLPELTEQTLLDNLRDRFNSGHIYTYIGPILVAVNPFNFFPIYNPKYSSLYCQSRSLGTLPPHIFAIADVTYHNMLRIKENQCVVISGESGSGKTESTNFLLHHLTTLSQKGGIGSSTIEQMLLSAGPVLEAFGNAVTLQNNNSSRFGKFIKINYREHGMVSGANVEIYLLEKSRIISQAVGERNYHVFYYLLVGASDEERKRHFLLEPKDYHYLNQNEFYACGEAMSEKNEFERLKHSMESVGFNAASQEKIFGMISAVLLLGNIKFIKRPGYHSDENAFIENEELIDMVAQLLNIKAPQLHQALTMRRTVLRHDTVVSRFTVSEAINTRDAMAKCLYNAVFHWIVLRINQGLIAKEATMGKKGYYIAILDIFGFEDVGAQWNSFEQLCINYANEHLQAYFNQHIFEFEQEEYLKEGIVWTNIEYTDNTECVQLFQNKPYGLLRLIDEESNINNGTDQSMLEKLNTFLKTNEYYEIPHKREDAFIVAHYAGKVKYQVTGFREKNKDLMRQDVMTVLKGSKSSFVRELVGDDPVAVYRWNLIRCTFRALFAFKNARNRRKRAGSVSTSGSAAAAGSSAGGSGSSHEPSVTLSRSTSSRRSSDSELPRLNAFLRGELPENCVPAFCDTSVFKTIIRRARQTPTKPYYERQSHVKSLQAVKEMIGKKTLSTKPTSVSRQFDYSLSRLMKTLSQATPYFIRCIKSNNEKIPNYFDDNIILRQLRYTGMLETVRIRRAGYSVRFEYPAFVKQYRILLPRGDDSTRDDIENFVERHPIIETENVQYGTTKIFMRDAEKLLLDDHLHRVIMERIITLQRHFKALLSRKQYLKIRNGFIKLQALTRGVIARSQLRRRYLSALCIQCWWRRYVARRRYLLVRDTVMRLQAIVRGNALRSRIPSIRRNSFAETLAAVKVAPGVGYTAGARGSLVLGKVSRVQTISLPKFDLNNPESLAAFALDDDDLNEDEDVEDDESAGSSSASYIFTFSSIEENDENMSSAAAAGEQRDNVDLNATFIVEDARLKLIADSAEKQQVQRRQSLATTASTAKLRMLRRAASTESDQLQQQINAAKLAGVASTTPSAATAANKKTAALYKTGFLKARKQLKALLTRRQDDGSLSTDGDAAINESASPVATSKATTSASAELMVGDNRECGKRPHNLKMTRLHKGESCAICTRAISGLLVQGLKCFACKLSFHKDCSSFVATIPCSPPVASPARSDSGTPVKKPWELINVRTTPRQSLALQLPFHGTFNLTKTKQQKDPTALLIESTEDLRQFSVFIFKKQTNLEQEKKKQRETVVDAIFKRSLREFHMELIGMEAVLRDGKTVLKYRDLIATFEGLLTKMCAEEKITFPTTLGVNAFRGFLNEFMQQRLKRRSLSMKSNIIKNVRKKRRRSDVTLYNGHRFKVEFVHVPTYCEMCNQFMWHAEKIFICINCRLSCHKKCHSKIIYICAKASKSDEPVTSRFFGADLSTLVDDEQDLPPLLDKLMMAVEVRGLFVEGIYRKSGALSTIRAIRKAIEVEEPENINFDDVPVHVLTTLVKSFFRELEEPLITQELYENFVNVSEIKETSERVRCLKVMVDMLPKANRCVLDRLMYHLARIAHQETVNRMNAANLAVIFAPCILRRSQCIHAQDQLLDVQKQAICVQALVDEKLKQYCETLNQFVELEQASAKVFENLRLIEEHRRSSGSTTSLDATRPTASLLSETDNNVAENVGFAATPESTESTPEATAHHPPPTNIEMARQLFEEQLHFLDKEKEKLIQELPPLAACPVALSEDLSSSDSADENDSDDGTPTLDSNTDSVFGRQRSKTASTKNRWPCDSREEYAIDIRSPPILCRLPHLEWWRAKLAAARKRRNRPPSTELMRVWKGKTE